MSTNNVAIRVEGLGKQYPMGELKSHTTIREALAHAAERSRRAVLSRVAGSGERAVGRRTLWALENVSFEVREGEVLGIIGHNGAGKSTLLKILSRITEPSSGRVEMYGRVGSLLEVGTGFHPELTGRENIYLNGAILGMSRAEISTKFDEIVAFSEVEEFLDMPVKRYSSGMYVRLAFAVAAHLEPEILLIDEVLSVGDVAFQRKCLGKMDDVARQGRTVVFVSHNLAAIRALCSRAIFLRSGGIISEGSAAEVVGTYLRTLEESSSDNLSERQQRKGEGQIRLKKIEISTREAESSSTLITGQPAHFTFYVTDVRPGMSCSFTIYDQFGRPITFFDSAVDGTDDAISPENRDRFVCTVENLLLLPGRYRLNAAVMCNGNLQDHVEGAAFVNVEQGTVQGRLVPTASRHGSVIFRHRWLKS